MKRIEKKFAELKKKSEKALVAYITAGDPDLETTRALIPALRRPAWTSWKWGFLSRIPRRTGPSSRRPPRRR